MADGLFRREVIQAQSGAVWGKPVGLVPPAWGIIIALLIALAVAAVVFVCLADFARRETVTGRLRFVSAEAKLYPVASGTLAELSIELGDHVEEGQKLAEVRTIRQISADKTLSAESLDALLKQEESLRSQIASAQMVSALERQRLTGEIAAADRDANDLAEATELIRQRLALGAERLTSAERLVAQGAASQEDVRVRKEAVLVLRQQLLDTETREAAAHSRRAGLAVQLERVVPEQARIIEQLTIELSEVALHSSQVRADAGFSVKAPIAGTVATLHARVGERVQGDRPLLTIVPEDQRLIAELFVPSRAIGFIEAGQPVRVLFDAFPYQKFGVGKASIGSISSTTLTPAELHIGARVEEAVYSVSAELDRQVMPAFGKEIPLQAGMEFTADIVLEERRLVEWLLEPLFAATKRNDAGR